MILDREVAELLDGRADLLAVADAVATTQARPATVRPWRLLAVAAVVAAAAVVAITAPWHGHGNGVVQRALAAIGGGPVLHAVVELPLAQTTIVDLSTGRQTPVEQRLEYWYDGRSAKLHFALTIRGQLVQSVELSGKRASFLDPALVDFLGGYRQALVSGAAKQTGRGTVDGRPVLWLKLPDAGLFGERVALDAATYRPLLIEELNADGSPATPGKKVVAIESLPRIPSGLPATTRVPASGRMTSSKQVAPTRAGKTLGWTPLWVGPAFGDLRRGAAQLIGTSYSIGSGTHPRLVEVESFFVSYGSPANAGDWIRIEEARQPLFGGFDIESKTPHTQLGVPVSSGSAVVSVAQGPNVNCQAQLRAGDVYVSIEEVGGRHCVAVAKALTPVRP